MTEDHDTETADVQLSITLPAEWSARERRRVEGEATRLRRTIEEQLASGMSPCDVAALFREYGEFEYVTLDEHDDGSILLDVRDRKPDDAESDLNIRTDGGEEASGDDTHDIRLVSFEGYRNLVTQVTQALDEHYYVIGTPTQRRSWRDLLEDGYTELEDALHVAEVGPFSTLDQLIDAAPDDERPSMVHEPLALVASDGVKRVSPFVYPAWMFGDPDTTTDIGRADTQLLATGVFPAEYVQPNHHRVRSPVQFLDVVDDLEAEYGDEYALMTGAFSPSGSFSVMDEESVKSIAGLQWPSGAFAETGISGLNALQDVFFGTLIVAREDLTLDAQDFLAGETDVISAPSVNEDDESDPNIRTDGGLLITGLDYECRVCERLTTVYVRIERDADLVVDGHEQRLHRQHCPDCDCERTHVALVSGPDDDAAEVLDG
jgi:hypothetical protein